LQPDDYIFPSFRANGLVQPHQQITSTTVQKQINKLAEDVGIANAHRFTTHCFRRGGAQYRFMFAPIGQRWTLARIRWWGGWAVGEHVSHTAKRM
jgi:integrase